LYEGRGATSSGRPVICAGIGFPVRKSATSAEKLLQLLLRPVSTGGGTRRVQLVRGEGRGASGQYGGRAAACPRSVGVGT